MPVGECRLRDFGIRKYIVMHGKSIFWAWSVSDGIPCGVDSKISKTNPESWGERVSSKDISEDIENDARSRDRRAKHTSGSYPFGDDHSTEICGKRSDWEVEGTKCRNVAQEV